MDFTIAPEIQQALHHHVDLGLFGYTLPSETVINSVINWLKNRYSWSIQKEWIVWLPGLVPALNVTCRCWGLEGEEVVTFTPVWPPFLQAPILSKRTLRTIDLIRKDNKLSFDLDRFKDTLNDRTRVFMLCNPHNPTGRVFSKAELSKLADLCIDRDMIICSDEIHCDLILDGKPHIPFATLSSEIAEKTITLMSPSKTFNLAGLNCGFAVIPNTAVRKRFIETRQAIVPYPNTMAYTACQAALTSGHAWHGALLDYLRSNRDYLADFFKNEIPDLILEVPEATYLAWIDCRHLKISHPGLFFENAGVGLSDGKDFGADGFVRLNFGCPRALLEKALNRMKNAVQLHINNSS